MQKLNEQSNEFKKQNNNEDNIPLNTYTQNSSQFPDEIKHLDDNTKPSYELTKAQKLFRTILGGIVLVFLAISIFTTNNNSGTLQASTVNKCMATGVAAGSTLSDNVKGINLLSKDYTVAVQSGGNIQLSIWDFLDKDGDYVQVYVDGKPLTAPFMISDKVVKVSVPDKGLIQVKGISDGSNPGISYAVYFNKTGETYFNSVHMNGTNTYTIKTAF